jgi:hypothetical protein
LKVVVGVIFINDLPECVTSRTCLFADDAIVYREIRSDQDCDKLQKDLLALAKWEELWGMVREKCFDPT